MQMILLNNSQEKKSLRKNIFKIILISYIIIVFSFSETGLLPAATLLLIFTVLTNKWIDKTLFIIKKFPIELKLLNLWILLAFFSGYFIAIDHNNFLNGISNVFFYIIIANFIALILLERTELINTIIVGIILAGIINLISVHLGYGEDYIERTGRAIGLTSNPNSLGLRMVYASAALLFIFILKKTKLKYLILTLILLIAFLQIILLSGSRKSLLTIIFFILGALLLYFTRNNQRIKIKTVFFSILFLVFLASITYFILPIILDGSVVGDRIEMGNERGGIEGDIRYEMYLYGIELMSKNPFLGVGMNNFRNYFWTGQYSHSDYIESITSTGLIGFLLYQSVYLIIIARGIKLFFTVKNKLARLYAGMTVLFIGMLKLIGTGTILFYSPGPMIILVLFSILSIQIKKGIFPSFQFDQIINNKKN